MKFKEMKSIVAEVAILVDEKYSLEEKDQTDLEDINTPEADEEETEVEDKKEEKEQPTTQDNAEETADTDGEADTHSVESA